MDEHKCFDHENEDDDDERMPPSSDAVCLYHDREFWKQETRLSSIKDWSLAYLRQWIESFLKRTHLPHKYEPLVLKVLRVMEEEDIGGELLLAGGKSYLTEKVLLVVSSKGDRMRLPHVVAHIFSALEEAQALRGDVSYWDRLWMGSAAGEALCNEFESKGEIGAQLRCALEPHPLEAIHFALICHLEAANNVIEADAYVCRHFSHTSTCLFKVVSIAPRDDPSVVWCNLIYVRSDLGLTGKYTGTARRGRGRQAQRHGRGQTKWKLLASVDFAQHGSAMPGHWHLNRNMCGDLLPHLRVSSGEEDGSGVWHGSGDNCPLWWNFIPDGMVHKDIPQKLIDVFSEVLLPQNNE